MELKRFVEKNGFIFVNREASLRFISEHNMTMAELKEVILGLEVKDCSTGRNPTGTQSALRGPSRSSARRIAVKSCT